MGTVTTSTFSSDTETVTRTKLNNLVSNLLTEFNGSIDNDNIKAGAAIVASKLNFATSVAIGGTTPAAGAFTTLSATGAVTLNGAVTLGDNSADDITITGSIASSIPLKDETVDIGTSSIGLNDIHFGSGGVINFDGGDVTLTHSAAKLTLGGDGAVELDFNNHEMTNVDIDSGAIDNAIIGGGTPAAITGTTLKADTSLELATGATVTGILDEDDLASDSDTQLATQQSIKKYVDDTAPSFGTWTTGTWNSSTQATTDLFLMVVGTVNSVGSYLQIRTDSSNPPTTIRGYSSKDGSTLVSLFAVVKKDDYYFAEVGAGNTSGTPTVYILPLS